MMAYGAELFAGRKSRAGLSVRKGGVAAAEDLHEFFAGYRLFLIEVIRQLVELVLIIEKNVFGLVMLALYQFDDLAVDLLLGIGRAGSAKCRRRDTGW
jgi:hypothetical protein